MSAKQSNELSVGELEPPSHHLFTQIVDYFTINLHRTRRNDRLGNSRFETARFHASGHIERKGQLINNCPNLLELFKCGGRCPCLRLPEDLIEMHHQIGGHVDQSTDTSIRTQPKYFGQTGIGA